MVFLGFFCATISHYFLFTLNYFIIFLVILLVCLLELHFHAKNEGRDPYFT